MLAAARRPDLRPVGAAHGRRQNLADLGGRRGACGSRDPRRPHTPHWTNLRSDGAGIGRSAPLCFASSPRRLGRPIRYRDVPLPAWSEGSSAQARFPEHSRQPSLGHDGVKQAGTLRPDDGHDAQTHRRSADEHARFCETPCRRVRSAWTVAFLRSPGTACCAASTDSQIERSIRQFNDRRTLSSCQRSP